jgi:hypothetical protein
LKPLPGLGKDLFEDMPVRRGCCRHQAASLRGCWGVCDSAFLPHLTQPRPPLPSALTGAQSSPASPLSRGDLRAIAKWKSLDDLGHNQSVALTSD